MLQGHTKQNQDSSRTVLVTAQLGCTDSLGSRPQYKFIIITSAFSHLGICYNQEVKETDKYLSSKHSFAENSRIDNLYITHFQSKDSWSLTGPFSPPCRENSKMLPLKMWVASNRACSVQAVVPQWEEEEEVSIRDLTALYKTSSSLLSTHAAGKSASTKTTWL